MTHWSDLWLGRQYAPDRFNCADLVLAVQREHFDRAFDVVGAHPTGTLAQSAAVEAEVRKHVEKVVAPIDGDVAIIRNRGRFRHIGVYCAIAGGCVLHAVKAQGVIRTRVRDMDKINMEIEGWYRPC
jgi:hypothetical protein